MSKNSGKRSKKVTAKKKEIDKTKPYKIETSYDHLTPHHVLSKAVNNIGGLVVGALAVTIIRIIWIRYKKREINPENKSRLKVALILLLVSFIGLAIILILMKLGV